MSIIPIIREFAGHPTPIGIPHHKAPKHPALRVIDFLTLNFIVELVAWNGETEKVIKMYETINLLSGLFAVLGAQLVVMLPTSGLPMTTSNPLSTWLVISAMGSTGVALINILNCSLIIMALQASPDSNQMIDDIPLGGIPLVVLVGNIAILFSYLCAFLYAYLPEFAIPIIAWFSVFLAIFLAFASYIFGFYLPRKITAHRTGLTPKAEEP